MKLRLLRFPSLLPAFAWGIPVVGVFACSRSAAL